MRIFHAIKHLLGLQKGEVFFFEKEEGKIYSKCSTCGKITRIIDISHLMDHDYFEYVNKELSKISKWQ